MEEENKVLVLCQRRSGADQHKRKSRKLKKTR